MASGSNGNPGGASSGSRMASQSQQPSSMQLSGIPGSGQIGSIYAAFGDYEREARQRKYMIAECEDVVAGLEQTLADRKKKNEALTVEAEKLEMEAKAAAANYETMKKEKALLENEFQKLSAEMDELTEKTLRKRQMLKVTEAMRKEKLEYAAAKTKEFRDGCMKITAIAKYEARKKANQDLEAQIREINNKIHALDTKLKDLKAQHSEKFETFQKTCIKMAEANLELRAKFQLRDELRAEFQKASKRSAPLSLGFGRSNSRSSQSLSQSLSQASGFQSQLQPLQRKIASLIPHTVASTTRSSSFQKMDRMFSSDNWRKYGMKPKPYEAPAKSSGELMPPPPSQTSLRLVSELRSRMKAPVVINPMPRHLGSPRGAPAPRGNQNSTTAPAPRSEPITSQVTGPSQEAAMNRPAQMDQALMPPPVPAVPAETGLQKQQEESAREAMNLEAEKKKRAPPPTATGNEAQVGSRAATAKNNAPPSNPIAGPSPSPAFRAASPAPEYNSCFSFFGFGGSPSPPEKDAVDFFGSSTTEGSGNVGNDEFFF